MAKPTFASVTEEPCKCGYLERAADDPQSPIVFDSQLNEYNFQYPSACGPASLLIYHCPFCGGAAPASKRALMFTVISRDEQQRLYGLFRGLRTLDEVIRSLGPPDEDLPRGSGIMRPESEGKPPTVESFRTLKYTRLSETAYVCVTDYHKDAVHVVLVGKYIGPPIDEGEA